jgi:regulator of sirC expression with transglutaminase-like and TPR domain
MNDTIVFYGLLDDEAVPIDAAALELSALDHDGASIDPYLELIDQMAARVLTLSADAQTAAEKSAVLATVIARENDFTGDRESYDAPVNADMIRVFDRRRGLPISLAIIYVAVARRLGWAAYVINLPGHVLVSLGEEEPALIDAFNHGAVIGTDDRAGPNLLNDRRSTMTQHVLRMSNRDVLVRLLQNQASRAEQEQDHERALTIYERMKTVAPASPQGWASMARVQLQVGAPAAARTNLIALLEITRDPDVRARISRALETIAEG